MAINSVDMNSPSGVLKLPQIKNMNSPTKREVTSSAVLKKSPYEAMKPSQNRQSMNEQQLNSVKLVQGYAMSNNQSEQLLQNYNNRSVPPLSSQRSIPTMDPQRNAEYAEK
jgi:hypothetical protein